MSESEDIINLTITEDDIAEAMEGDDETHLIMIKLEESNTSSDKKTKLIPSKLKGKFLNKTIAFYKNKCQQYIKQRKAE